MLFKQRYMEQLIWFTRQFYILNTAGMGFGFSLKMLQKSCGDKKLALKMSGILRELERGRTFSQSLAKYPELFDHFYVEMIQVGERTGKLTEVLQELQKFWELKQRFWQELMRALLYPCVVMGIMVLLTVGLCFTVIPKFQQIFASFHAPLPWMTLVLFNSVDFLKKYFIALFVFIGISFWFGRRFLQNQIHQLLQTQRILRVPVFGKFYQASLLFKFYRVLGIALKAGLSMQEGVRLLRKMFAGTPFKRVIPLLEYDLQNGRRLTEIFDRKTYFPEICQGLIHIAEETGTLDQQFLNLAGIFEEQVALSLERFKILLEPLMMLVTGGMVGAVVIAIYYPIFSLGGVV